MAHIVMAYIVMAYIGMAYIGMAYIGKAYIVIARRHSSVNMPMRISAHICTHVYMHACIHMSVCTQRHALYLCSYGPCSCGLCSYGPCSYGPCSHGLCSYGPCSRGLCSYGRCVLTLVLAHVGAHAARDKHLSDLRPTSIPPRDYKQSVANRDL